MHTFRRWSLALAFIAAVASPALLAGCTARATYFDAEYSDYHPWNHQEIVFYSRWETETRRPHVEFKNRAPDEQREYWHWRHDQH